MSVFRKIVLFLVLITLFFSGIVDGTGPYASAAGDPAPVEVSLLRNGGFESVTGAATVADSWTKNVSSGATGVFNVIDSGDAELQRFQQVSGSGLASNKIVSILQTIPVLPDTGYTLSGRFRVNNLVGSRVQLYVDFLDGDNTIVGTGKVETSSVSENFVELRKTGVTPASAAKAKVFAILRSTSASGSGSFDVDAMSFTLSVVDTVAPSAPANLTVTENAGTSVGLSWTASTDNLGVSGYDIYNGADKIGSTSGTQFTVPNLQPKTAYWFSVVALDASGNVSPSTNIDVTTVKYTNLLKNGDFESLNGPSDVAVEWKKTVSSGSIGTFAVVQSDDATARRVQRISGAGLASGKLASVSQTIPVLADSEYKLSGRFKASSLDGARIQLWVDFLDAGGAVVGSGKVESTAVSSSFVALLKTGITPATATKANVFAILRSTSASGSGSFDVDAMSFTLNVEDTQAPSMPTNLTVSENAGTSIGLSWTASTDNLGVAEYEIYNGADLIGSTTGTQYTIPRLQPNTEYTFGVKATDSSDNASDTANLIVTTGPDLNLLKNGDFESLTGPSDVAEFWTKTVSSGGSGTFNVTDTGDATVHRVQRLSGEGLASGKAVSVSQTVYVESGAEYILGGRFRVNDLTGARVQLWIDFTDASNAVVGSAKVESATVSSGFVALQKTGTTPVNATKAKVFAILRSTSANGSGSFDVDAMTLTVTPSGRDIVRIEEVPSIVAKLGSPLPLPARADVALQDGSSIKVDISWDLRPAGYDDLIALKQPFVVTGQLTNLPAGVTNSLGLAVTINVVPEAPTTPTVPDIKEVLAALSPVTVAWGTQIYDLGMLLPEHVEVLMDDNSRRPVDVYWETYKVVVPSGTGLEPQSVAVPGVIKVPNANGGGAAEPGKQEPSSPYTNSKNLGVVATVTFDTLQNSALIVQSLPYLQLPYEVEKQVNPTAASLGLPSRAQATLGNGSTVTADVAWQIAGEGSGYRITGSLSNFPAGVVNPGFKIQRYISTYELTDIKQVPYFNEPYVAHGVEKTAQGLGLPAQVEVTLYNGNIASLPVTWNLDNAAYDPAIGTPQNFPVQGKFGTLPAGVTNGRMLTVNTWVHVAADPNNVEINASPATLTSRVPVGSPKTSAGLGLPAQVKVSLSNGTTMSIDVQWHLEWSSYDPAATYAQSFYVSGNFVNLPAGIYNSNGYNVSVLVITQIKYLNGFASLSRSLSNGAPKTVEGLQLPAQVEGLMYDNSTLLLDVIWNVEYLPYDPASRREQSFTVSGTVTNLPSGVINLNNARPQVYVYVAESQDNRYVVSGNPITVRTEVEHGVPATIEGFALPRQVDVTLSDESQIPIDVDWKISEIANYDPAKTTRQFITVSGRLTNLPEGVYDTQKTLIVATVTVKPPKYIVGYVHRTLSAPHGTAKNLEDFHLPPTVEAILGDDSKMDLKVVWRVAEGGGWDNYSPDNPSYQTFRMYADFVDLPPHIINDLPLVFVGVHAPMEFDVEVWADPSIKRILRIPEQPVSLVNGFQLLHQVDVQLDNGTVMKIEVNWNIGTSMSGSFILPEGINNPRNKSLAIGVEEGLEAIIRDSAYPPWPYGDNRYNIIWIKPVSVIAGEPLPTYVQATIDNKDYSTVTVPVCWYGGQTSDNSIAVGIPCGEGTMHSIRNYYNKVAVANIIPLQVTSVPQFDEAIPFDDLPTHVNVQLNNGTSINTKVCWIAGNYPPTGIFTVVGVLCELPTGVQSTSDNYMFADTYISLGSGTEEPPAVTPVTVVEAHEFNEVMSQSDLPSKVNVRLSNGQTILASVCWSGVNLELLGEDDIAIVQGQLCNLPSDISNPDGIKSLAYIHRSVTDLFFDFYVASNDPTVQEQVQNVRFVDSDGIIHIHVTSHDHPILSATANFYGTNIPLTKVSDNEYAAAWRPSDEQRGLEVDSDLSNEDLEALSNTTQRGNFHSFEVKIYPYNDTVRSITKQVYIAVQDEDEFKAVVTNLPMPRVLQPANALYNCLAYALDEPYHYLWAWYNNEQTAPVYPSPELVVAYMSVKGYVQVFDPSEATILAFGTSTNIYHFAKYDSATGISTSKMAMGELLETQGIPEYSNGYGTVQLYFKKDPSLS